MAAVCDRDFVNQIDYDYEPSRTIKMKTVTLPDGERVRSWVRVPGAWERTRGGQGSGRRITARHRTRHDIDDTAEMYGEGGAEKVVADAIEDQRDRVFVVTKVYPHNASCIELPRACERSLKHLRIDVIDLSSLRSRGRRTRLVETVEAFEKLRAAGKIKRWGVSNFDVDDMEELVGLS